MAGEWNPRTTLGISNTQSAGITCVATRNTVNLRCLNSLSGGNRDIILSEIDNMPETAPASPGPEAAALKRIAPISLCRCHNDDDHVASVVRRWQKVLTAGRAVRATSRALQSEGISNVDDSEDDDDDNDVSSLGSSARDSDLDDGLLPNGDDTIGTTISIFSDSNPEPNESPETENLHERLEQVTLDVSALREQVERNTPELNELRQQLARATPDAEAEDPRRLLEQATAAKEQLKRENEQLRHENAQRLLDHERDRHENQRLQQQLDLIRRISADRDVEPPAQEGQPEPSTAQPRHIGGHT